MDRVIIYEMDDQWQWERRSPDDEIIAWSYRGYETRALCEDEAFRVNAKPFTAGDSPAHVCAPTTIGGPDHCGICGRTFEQEELNRVADQLWQMQMEGPHPADMAVDVAHLAVMAAAVRCLADEYAVEPGDDDGSLTEARCEQLAFAARDLVRAINTSRTRKPDGWDD